MQEEEEEKQESVCQDKEGELKEPELQEDVLLQSLSISSSQQEVHQLRETQIPDREVYLKKEAIEIEDVTCSFSYFQYTGTALPVGVLIRVTKQEGMSEKEVVVCDFVQVPDAILVADKNAMRRFEASRRRVMVEGKEAEAIPYFYREEYFDLFNRTIRSSLDWVVGGRGIGKSHALVRMYWELRNGDEGSYEVDLDGERQTGFRFEFDKPKHPMNKTNRRKRKPVMYIPNANFKLNVLVFAIDDVLNQWLCLNKGRFDNIARRQRSSAYVVKAFLRNLAGKYRLELIIPLLQQTANVGRLSEEEKEEERKAIARDEETRKEQLEMFGVSEYDYDNGAFSLVNRAIDEAETAKEEDMDEYGNVLSQRLFELLKRAIGENFYLIIDQMYTEENTVSYEFLSRIFGSMNVLLGFSYNGVEKSGKSPPKLQDDYDWHSLSKPLSTSRAVDMLFFHFYDQGSVYTKSLLNKLFEYYESFDRWDKEGRSSEPNIQVRLWLLFEDITGYVPINIRDALEGMELYYGDDIEGVDQADDIYLGKCMLKTHDQMLQHVTEEILSAYLEKESEQERADFLNDIRQLSSLPVRSGHKTTLEITLNFRYISIGNFRSQISEHRNYRDIFLMCELYKRGLLVFLKYHEGDKKDAQAMLRLYKNEKLLGENIYEAFFIDMFCTSEGFLPAVADTMPVNSSVYDSSIHGDGSFQLGMVYSSSFIKIERDEFNQMTFRVKEEDDLPDTIWRVYIPGTQTFPVCDIILRRRREDDTVDIVCVQLTTSKPSNHMKSTKDSVKAEVRVLSRKEMNTGERENRGKEEEEEEEEEEEDTLMIGPLQRHQEQQENEEETSSQAANYSSKFTSILDKMSGESTNLIYIYVSKHKETEVHLPSGRVFKNDIFQYFKTHQVTLDDMNPDNLTTEISMQRFIESVTDHMSELLEEEKSD